MLLNTDDIFNKTICTTVTTSHVTLDYLHLKQNEVPPTNISTILVTNISTRTTILMIKFSDKDSDKYKTNDTNQIQNIQSLILLCCLTVAEYETVTYYLSM